MNEEDFDQVDALTASAGWPPVIVPGFRAGVFASDLIKGMAGDAGLLWDHDPTKTLPLVDRRGAEPVKIGDGVLVQDEEGNTVFEGTVDAPILRDDDYSHFSITPNPDGSPTWGIDANAADPREGHWEDFRCKMPYVPITTTKESRMHTLVTINATGPTDGAAPFATIEVDHEGPAAEPIERAIAAAQGAARELLEGLGLKPWTVPPQITHKMKDAEEIAEEVLRAVPDTEDGDPPAPETEQLYAMRIAMYGAIGSVAPNLQDLAKELQDAEDGIEGSEGFRERLGRIGRTLAANADTLTDARVLPERG